jgi:hypothetical protein
VGSFSLVVNDFNCISNFDLCIVFGSNSIFQEQKHFSPDLSNIVGVTTCKISYNSNITN